MHGAGGRGAGLISHLLPVQLVLVPGGPRPGLQKQESPVPPGCVLGLSVPALKQLCILLGVSLEASRIFFSNWPRFTKWSVYACHTEINQAFFSMESKLYSHLSACRCLLTGSLLGQESIKRKAVVGQ